MIDRLGREIDYVRISVTDRCNLRCRYCMPEEGVQMAGHADILRYSEIIQIAEAMAGLGVHKIKLTGGEPLVRRNLPQLVADLKRIEGITQVTLTTNGVLLGEQMEALAEAGIDGVNISLDTLDPGQYSQITRRDEFGRAYEGILTALKYKDIVLKINCVLLGQSPEEIVRIAGLARENPIHVRFIEMMPIGLGNDFTGMTEDKVLSFLRPVYGTEKAEDMCLGNGPAHYFCYPGLTGRIGFISAVSHKFCKSCNRVRLTSQGFLKTCLQYETGKDLRDPLRRGASREELKDLIVQALAEKPDGHAFFQEKTGSEEHKIMSQIGG